MFVVQGRNHRVFFFISLYSISFSLHFRCLPFFYSPRFFMVTHHHPRIHINGYKNRTEKKSYVIYLVGCLYHDVPIEPVRGTHEAGLEGTWKLPEDHWNTIFTSSLQYSKVRSYFQKLELGKKFPT